MPNSKVIRIKRSKNVNDRINVYLENKNVFSIPEDVFVLSPFNVGDTLNEKEIESLNKKLRLRKAKDFALRLLSFRMRSIGEIKKRLHEKGYNNEEIKVVVNRMIDLNYLDDKKFGKAFVRAKVKNKKIGPLALSSELLPYFLPKELVDELIQEVYEEFKPYDLIEFHLNKRGLKREVLIDKKLKKRTDNFLVRKGFKWETIRSVYLDWGFI